MAAEIMARRVGRPKLDKHIRQIRLLLEQADYVFWEDVARTYERYGERNALELVQYPQHVYEEISAALVDVARTAWELGIERTRRRIRGQRVDVFFTGDQGRLPIPDETKHALEVATDIVMPEETIQRYVDTRIPPLTYTVERERREIARNIVAYAIRQGEGVGRIVDTLRTEGFGISQLHRENIARTETAMMFEHGTMAHYTADPSITGFEFVAIMDSRTTEICEYMDGRQFAKGDADGVVPPLHYMCRSTTIPVFLFDTQPSYEGPGMVLAGAQKSQRPLEGFGGIAYEHMPPAADASDLYRDLSDSESAQVRGFAEEIRQRAEQLQVT